MIFMQVTSIEGALSSELSDFLLRFNIPGVIKGTPIPGTGIRFDDTVKKRQNYFSLSKFIHFYKTHAVCYCYSCLFQLHRTVYKVT